MNEKELKNKVHTLTSELYETRILLDKKRSKNKKVFSLDEIDTAFYHTIEKQLKHLGYHTTDMIVNMKKYLEENM